MRARLRVGWWTLIVALGLVFSQRRAAAAETGGTVAAASNTTLLERAEGSRVLQQAQARHARGVELYRQKRYAEALEEFERTYSLYRDPRLLFSLGQLHYELRHYSPALLALRTYLDKAAGSVSAERRSLVERQIEALREKTGYLDVSLDVAGASIGIDGQHVGLSPLPGPVLVDAGYHRVTAARPGHAPASVQVDVRGVEPTELALHLVPLAHSSNSAAKTALWTTTVGLGVLALASTIVTAVSHGNYEAALRKPAHGDPALARRDLEHRQQRVRLWAAVSDVLTGAALVSGGVALYVSLEPDEGAASGPSARGSLPSSGQIGATFEF
ncbi:MAG: PEGA domain-containing protein [Deltaproteobacteria bacterium]